MLREKNQALWRKCILYLQTICLLACLLSLGLILKSLLFNNGYISVLDPENQHFHCNVRHIGCFEAKDIVNLIEEPVYRIKGFVEKRNCQFKCFIRKFHIAVHHGNNCSCGSNLNKSAFSFPDKVNVSNEEACGKSNYDVYWSKEHCEIGPVTLPEVYEKHYGGCFYRRENFRKIFQKSLSHSRVNPPYCVLHCQAFGFSLAVTQDTNCYCGNTAEGFLLSDPLDDAKCLSQYDELMSTYDIGGTSDPEDLSDEVAPVAVWRTYSEDKRCSQKRFFESTHAQQISLVGLSGSGVTWLRSMMEAATGYYSASTKAAWSIYNSGFLGEFSTENILFNRTTYSTQERFAHGTKVVMLVRNPYDVLQALYTTLIVNKKELNLNNPYSFPRDWDSFATTAIGEWVEMYYVIMNENPAALIVYYDDLLNDRIGELRKIIKFMGVKVTDLEDRMMCVRSLPVGFVHDQTFPQLDEPYNAYSVLVINEAIRLLRAAIASHGYPPLPQYER